MKNFMLILCIRCWYSVSGSDTLYQDLIPHIRFQCITFWRILQKMKNFMLILCIRCWYSVSGADTLYQDLIPRIRFQCITFWRILQNVKNFMWRIFILKNFQSGEFPKETQLFRRIFIMKNFHSEEFSITDTLYLNFNK